MSLLPFWALKVSVVLLSMEGQNALGFHQKYLNIPPCLERHEYLMTEFSFLGELRNHFGFHKGITNHTGLYHEGE